MSIEHTARTGADKGYFMIVPEDCCSTMNADWHRASVQLRHAERRRGDQIRRGDRGTELARHCESAATKQSKTAVTKLDCFVASLSQ